MERLKQIKGAIFDLDGTLLDSMWVWEEIDNKFLISRGIKPSDDYKKAISGMEFSQAAIYTVHRFHLKETPEAVMKEWTELSQYAYAHEIKLKPMAKEYLRALAQKGIKLGIATSSTEELFIPTLKNNGIYDLFSAFTTTGEVAKGKQFPDVYLKAASKLGLHPSTCAVFEDILIGIQGANNGGFLTIGVYDEFSKCEKSEIISNADIFIHTFSELL